MKPIQKMNSAEIAAMIQEHLREYGIDTILSGGACVSVYSEGKYTSLDIDLIHTSLMSPKRNIIREHLQKLGFGESGRHYTNPSTQFSVEFPSGPPAIGEEPLKDSNRIQVSTGQLHLLSPTDCVKDRLVWYFHDGDLQCLEQAILVAEAQPIDLPAIKRWSTAEGKLAEFEKFQSKLIHNQSK